MKVCRTIERFTTELGTSQIRTKAKGSLLYSEFPETISPISHRSHLRTATFCSSDLDSVQKLIRS